jgi:uncharacterized RDD family membrane protein YckC
MPSAERPSLPLRREPERVLRVRVSGFPRRFAAAVIDRGILFGLTAVVTLSAAMALRLPLPHLKEIGPDLLVAGVLEMSPLAFGALGLWLGLTTLYELYFAGMMGQSPGMKVMGLRIISVRGRPPGAARGFVRLAAFLVSVVPAALGWLWAIFDREHRAWHDHVAGTYVILDDGAVS